MAFASGAATFNSCNKAGSIVEFTNHLRIHPNDYNALMWRARAYGIVGQPKNALQDIEHAISVSSGVKRENAKAQKIRNSGSVEDYGRHANRTVTIYPNEWTAWSELAEYYKDIGNEEEATRCNMKSLDLATKNNETSDPDICWKNYDIGNYWMKKGDAGAAKRYFEAAIESSPTHTVSHINLCVCNIDQGNIPAAKQNFQTAKSLNPGLASQTFQTENFDEYCSRLRKQRKQQYTSASSSAAGTQASETPGGGSKGGATGGSGGGNGSGSDDGGSDSNDNDPSATWKRLHSEALSKKRYNNRMYVQSKCGKYWYSRDTAGHGGAQFKRYEDTRSSLRFKDSVDANLKPLASKHESREGTVIRKSDMDGVNLK